MTKAEEIFDRNAKSGMVWYNRRDFRRKFPTLYGVIIKSIEEALATIEEA